MAETPPELIEQIGSRPNGATWKARQPDGREVLASQTILTDEPARQAALDRLRKLAPPALAVTPRAIAAGTMRSDITAALAGLRETSGPLGGAERLSLGAGELAALVAAKRGGATAGQVSYRNLNAPIGSGSMAVPRAEPARAPAQPVAPAPPRPAPPVPAAAAGTGAPPASVQPRRSWGEGTEPALQP